MHRTPWIAAVPLLLLLSAIAAVGQTTQTFAPLNGNNTGSQAFTQLNQFNVGIEAGPITFSQLSGLSAFTTLVYVSDGTLGSNPCTGGGSGALAVYIAGSWNCNAGSTGGGSGTVTSVGSSTGLTGGPITSTGSLSIAPSYQLPQNCSNGQVAQWDSTTSKWDLCSTGGSGNVSTGPSITQTIAQPAGTEFDANNFNSIREYSPTSYNWSQTLSGTGLTGAQTLTFSGKCPLGVIGADTNLYVQVNSDAEIDAVTGGTCTPSLASGTITFTLSGTYTNPTIASASDGIYEAIVDAEGNGTSTFSNNWRVDFAPTNPASSTYYPVYAPVTIKGSVGLVNGYGAAIDCESKSSCFLLPINSTENVIQGFRFGTKTTMNGAQITNVACASNVSTVTSTLNPGIGTYVDMQYVDSTHYWGVHGPVQSSSSTSFTLADNNCAWASSTGSGTIASTAVLGQAALEHANVEDDGNANTFRDIIIDSPGWATGLMNNILVIGNDQNITVDTLQTTTGTNCSSSANYCGNVIYAPGGTVNGVGLAAVGHVRNSQLSLQCHGNGINWLSGNGLDVRSTIIEGQSMFELQTGSIRSGIVGADVDYVYGEYGSACTNPLYVSSGFSGSTAESFAGASVQGGSLNVASSNLTVEGNEPNFCTGTGGTSYELLAVIHDGSSVSWPLRFGTEITPSATCTIGWPRYASPSGNVVTYDILKVPTTGGINFPVAGVAANTALSTSVAQCSNYVCSFSDTQASLSSYTPAASPALQPFLIDWPGNIVLADNSLLYTQALVDDIVATRYLSPAVIGTWCPAEQVAGLYAICTTGDSATNNNPPQTATLLPEGGTANEAVNVQGRLNILLNTGVDTQPTELITFSGSPASVLADSNHRPAASTSDFWIGSDSTSALGSQSMAVSAPVEMDIAIAQTPSNAKTNALEKLTSSGKTITVPLTLSYSGANPLLLPNMSGLPTSGNYCLEINASGGVSPTGAACGSTSFALTMNNSGSGATSGTTFNGSAAETISYNTVGASPTCASGQIPDGGTCTGAPSLSTSVTVPVITVSGSGPLALESGAYISCTQATPCASTATSLVSSASNAMYRADVSAACTSATTSATVNVTISYTDPSGTAQTFSAATSANCTTLGPASVLNLIQPFMSESGTAINYSVTTVNSPSYQARVVIYQETAN